MLHLANKAIDLARSVSVVYRELLQGLQKPKEIVVFLSNRAYQRGQQWRVYRFVPRQVTRVCPSSNQHTCPVVKHTNGKAQRATHPRRS